MLLVRPPMAEQSDNPQHGHEEGDEEKAPGQKRHDPGTPWDDFANRALIHVPNCRGILRNGPLGQVSAEKTKIVVWRREILSYGQKRQQQPHNTDRRACYGYTQKCVDQQNVSLRQVQPTREPTEQRSDQRQQHECGHRRDDWDAFVYLSASANQTGSINPGHPNGQETH